LKHGIYSPFFPSKCSLFHNSKVFGSCIIHILYTECAKIKKNSGANRLIENSASCWVMYGYITMQFNKTLAFWRRNYFFNFSTPCI